MGDSSDNKIDIGQAVMDCVNGYSAALNQLRMGFVSQLNNYLNSMLSELASRGEQIKKLEEENYKLKAELEGYRKLPDSSKNLSS